MSYTITQAIKDGIQQSQRETAQQEQEQADTDISVLLIHKPRAKRISKEISKRLEYGK